MTEREGWRQRGNAERHNLLSSVPWLVLLLIFTWTGTALGGSPDTRAQALADSIGDLRARGMYVEALTVGRELLARRQADTEARPYQVRDAERLVQFLESALALPQEQWRALAEADSLALVVATLDRTGRFREAVEVAEKPVRIHREILGDDHYELANSLGNLAVSLGLQGRSAEAEPLAREALAINLRTLGEEHPDCAQSEHNLASILRNLGKYDEAEDRLRRALATRRTVLGPDNLYVATTLNALGVIHQDQGDYAAAEPLFREAIAVAERLLGEEHPYVTTMRINLGGLLWLQGDDAAAEEDLRSVLQIEQGRAGGPSPRTAICLNNLANVMLTEKNYPEAERLQREGLAIQTKLYGQDHPDVAMSLNNLAAIIRDEGKYTDAEPLLRQSLAIRTKLLGDDHLDVAMSLSNLANDLDAQGKYEEAEHLYRKALSIYQGAGRISHPQAAKTLYNFGLMARATGKTATAESLLVEACSAFEEARMRLGVGVRRATFLKSPYYPLAETRLSLGKEAEAWPAAEGDLGRVLADLLRASDRRFLSPAEVSREDSLKRTLADMEGQLDAFRASARADSSDAAAQRIAEARSRLLAAESAWSTLQADIASRHSVTEGRPYDLASVQRCLTPKQAIIGWLEPLTVFGHTVASGWGYVIRSTGPVQWRRLPITFDNLGTSHSEESPSSAEAFRNDVSQRPIFNEVPLEAGLALWRERFAPLAECLDGVQHLIAIPSGELLGIPLEAIPVDDGKATLGDLYSVSYTPSATIYAWLVGRSQDEAGRQIPGRHALQVRNCLAIGDPPFAEEDLAAVTRGEVSLAPPEGDLALLRTPLTRTAEHADTSASVTGMRIVRSALAGDHEILSRLKRLPSTRTEVEALEGPFGNRLSLLLGPDASEQNLVQMAEKDELQQFGIIHIATHALVDDEQPERSGLILSQVGLPDPLVAATAGTRIYDGVLTASEIVREWKLDADLVTLSACRTALGRKVAGEGYVGFAHAFFQAGARCLLVSLWGVEDRSTALLMQRFYTNLAAGGSHAVSKAEALREAKQWLRGYVDETGEHPYAHPYYWSAFILIGDPW
jgi:CHAT domain-containing protein/tetratricopeptide (TPR) repeat protein